MPSILHHISIHAAREGGDNIILNEACSLFISIHAAREGGDKGKENPENQGEFQSTPPVKAATGGFAATPDPVTISIHAAREGGDPPSYQ